ncbi:unnamed protein product [Brassica rapa subsp. trilocularis]
MLASHTSIRHLFSKFLRQYDQLRKKQPFLDNYRKFSMFAQQQHIPDICILCVCVSQDPEQLFIGEGNALGVVDPKLAF